MIRTRCAIYTRKSSEDGLEQDFNSLDAQREACEAYIQSQKAEGWVLHPEAFDDGGLSGGTLERPGLQNLLGEIKAGRVDRIVVYKIDRLTRSLADFAKIVDVLDAAGASFVSVTQSFNTATSMGRLTLNMLLSFAQFEREVTAERIRDKIAASKRRGLWMGGNAPQGYKPNGRTLVLDYDAEVVRTIYRLYEDLGTLRETKHEVDRLGLKTAVRKRADGSSRGGLQFSLGHIHHMLTNPIYAGRIRHKREVYPGQHPAIIEPARWDRLQNRLERGATIERDRTLQQAPVKRASRSKLTGKIFDETGDRLTPSHTKMKTGKRLRYYVSRRLTVGSRAKDVGGWRLPAADLENRVAGLISGWLAEPKRAALLVENASADWMRLASAKLAESQDREQKEQFKILKLVDRINIRPGEIEIVLCLNSVAGLIGVEMKKINADADLTVKAEFQLRKRGVETKLIISGEANARDEVLWANIAKGHRYFDMIRKGMTFAEITAETGVPKQRVQKLVDLALLAPDIIRDVLHGKQPIGLTTEWLIRHAMPADWREQRDLIAAL